MTMLMVNIFEAKAKLSEFLDAAARGERVLICKRNRPVAELRAVETTRTDPRPLGLARGGFTVPDSFFEPLPDDVMGEFYGIDRRANRSKVDEAPPSEPYGSRKPPKGGRKR